MPRFTSRRDFSGPGDAVDRRLASARHGKPAHGAGGETTAKIKIGQIGTGHAHATKLEVYRRSPDYEVVGIVEPDESAARAQPVAGRFRDLPWMTEEQLLNQPGLQAVLVETRVRNLLDAASGRRRRQARASRQAGRRIARAISPAACNPPEQQKLLVQMGYMFRYSPAVVLMRQFLADGWLGEVFEVQAVMSKVVPPADRQKLAEYPGGMMFELGPHVIDLLVSVSGRPESVKSFARHSRRSMTNWWTTCSPCANTPGPSPRSNRVPKKSRAARAAVRRLRHERHI